MIRVYNIFMPTPWDLVKNGQEIEFTPPFPSILAVLEHFAEKNPKKEALIFDDFDNGKMVSISYQELLILVKQTANFLSEHLGTNKTFGFAFSNRPEILILNLAAGISGKISVPLDIKRDSPAQKAYKLKLTGAKLLFPSAGQTFPDFQKKIGSFPTEVTYRAALNDDCLILFTSGTTNLPKGVRLTGKSLLANADSIADWLKFDESDRFNILLPLHHINSITFCLTTLISGGTIVLSPRYSKSRFWETLAKYACTGSSIVPTIAYDLLSEKESFEKHKTNLKQVRRFQIGSAPVNPAVVEKLLNLYLIPLIQGYGQTETSLRSTGVPMNLTPRQYRETVKLNTIGTELKWTNVTILNGEICVRGPVITPGYLKDSRANEKAFANNWFHSGDRGYFKMLFGKKFFFLTGRTAEIIKKGGTLISPLSIENKLSKNYPDLKQVFVVGFPDVRMGEEIGFVSLGDEKAVGKVLEDARLGKITGLSEYETPTAGLAIGENELPKTSTGKVMRSKIKEIFAARLFKNSLTVAATGDFSFRLIKPYETDHLKEALEINNLAWGKNLQSSIDEFTARSANGILIGAFDAKNNLLGTVSALKTTLAEFESYHSWLDVTGNGTLKTFNRKGDILVCVAISTPPASSLPLKSVPKIQLTEKEFEKYIESEKDYVIRFHRKPKAGFPEGAKIIKILPNFRPEDKDALGYNILMKYPALDNKPQINPAGSTGTQLIEAALLYGFYQNIRDVYVLTRPAQASQYFEKQV